MPRNIDLKIKAPASKSESLRAVLLSILYSKPLQINNMSNCNDAIFALKMLSQCREYSENSNSILTTKSDNSLILPEIINCGESAFLARAIAGISPFLPHDIIIKGKGTLNARNFSDLTEFCSQNSIPYHCESNHLPIRICKCRHDSHLTVSALSSSQLLSGVLIGNAFAEIPKVIHVDRIVSSGYVELTLNMLKNISIEYLFENDIFTILSRRTLDNPTINISGDWSGAAFLLVAGAIAGKVEISGLDIESNQPDKAILNILKEIRASVNIDKCTNFISCERNILNSFDFDASNCPDLIPPLVALAVNCDGVSKIKGINRLLNKESNRLKTLYDEFNKVGADIQIVEDSFQIRGKQITGGAVNSHSDHRIAMALAIAGLNSFSGMEIMNHSVVSKSYPDFFADLLS